MVSFIHDKLRFCFVDIPLSCSLMVTDYFFADERDARLEAFSPLNAGLPIHAGVSMLAERLGRDFDNYFTFAYYRDPFDYLLAQYDFLIRRPRHKQFDLVEYKSFEEFVLSVPEGAIRLQSSYVSDDERVRVTRLEPFQTCDVTFVDVLAELGIAPVSKLRAPRKSRKHLKAYTPEMIIRVNEIMAPDIAIFGTCFPPKVIYRPEKIERPEIPA